MSSERAGEFEVAVPTAVAMNLTRSQVVLLLSEDETEVEAGDCVRTVTKEVVWMIGSHRI